MSNRKLSREIDLYRVDNDVNGDPRYVIHYTEVPYFIDYRGEGISGFSRRQNAHMIHAANVLYGRAYRAKWSGGGIVFSTYNLKDTLRKAGVSVPADL